MKTTTLFSLFTVLLSIIFTLNAKDAMGGSGGAGSTLQLVAPANNSRQMVGSDLRIEWKHNPAHAGKTVHLNIRLTDLTHFALAGDASVTIADKDVGVATTTPSNGMWNWHIPSDFKAETYRLNVSETYAGSGTPQDPPDLPGGSWDYVFVSIGPVPAIKFASRYGQPLRIGTFPKFNFTMAGASSVELRPYLRKDGQFLGRIGGFGYTPDWGTGTVYWDVTQYYSADGIAVLPKAGTGYSILAGIMKDPSKPDFALPMLEDFVDFDETDRFTLTPPPPVVVESISSYEGKKTATLYVIGDVGIRYSIQYAPALGLPFGQGVEFIAGSDAVRITANVPPNEPKGFFAVTRLGTKPGLAGLSQKELSVSFIPLR